MCMSAGMSEAWPGCFLNRPFGGRQPPGPALPCLCGALKDDGPPRSAQRCPGGPCGWARRAYGTPCCALVVDCLQAKFRQALVGLPATERPDALLGLAECLQQLAERVMADAQALPDAALTLQAEACARERACQLYTESVRTYQQVWRACA